jgi:putative hydrolase of the HAD superfamily
MEKPFEFEAVFFDATRTLIFPSPSSAEVYVQKAAAHGIDLDVEKMKTVVKDLWLNFYPLRRDTTAVKGTNEKYEKSWWQQFINKAFSEFGAQCPLECFEEIFCHFARGDSWDIYPDTVPVVTELRGRGLQTGIISNFDRRLLTILNETSLVRHFDHVLISSIVGWEKPDPPIFAEAVRLAGVPASRCVHIGDSLEADFQGARGAGFGPILLTRGDSEFSRVLPLESIHPELPAKIDNLYELLQIL